MSKRNLPTLTSLKLSKIRLEEVILICELKDGKLTKPQIGEVVFNTDEHVEIKTQKKFSKKHMKQFYGAKWAAYKISTKQ